MEKKRFCVTVFCIQLITVLNRRTLSKQTRYQLCELKMEVREESDKEIKASSKIAQPHTVSG